MVKWMVKSRKKIGDSEGVKAKKALFSTEKWGIRTLYYHVFTRKNEAK